MILCLVCDGSGWRRRRAGEIEWDRYCEMPVAEAVSFTSMPVAITSATESDREQSYGWERARAAHDRYGSYKELRRALDWLRDREPRRYTLVRVVLIDHESRRLSAPDALSLDLGVVSIALRMRTVRVPPWLMERRDADRRQQSIAQLAAEGRTAGEIARRLDIPKGTVRKLLHRSRIQLTPGPG